MRSSVMMLACVISIFTGCGPADEAGNRPQGGDVGDGQEVSNPDTSGQEAAGRVSNFNYYPDCESQNGNSCSDEGVFAHCWWVKASEPAMCRCDGSTFTCPY